MEFSRQEYWSGLPFPELPDPGNYASCGAFQAVLVVKNPPANAGDMGFIPGQEDPLEEGMATHCCILAWRIPRTEEPGKLCP